jgi:hypothetical protein
MKKPFFAALLAACVVVSLAAQEVTDTGAFTVRISLYLGKITVKTRGPALALRPKAPLWYI